MVFEQVTMSVESLLVEAVAESDILNEENVHQFAEAILSDGDLVRELLSLEGSGEYYFVISFYHFLCLLLICYFCFRCLLFVLGF